MIVVEAVLSAALLLLVVVAYPLAGRGVARVLGLPQRGVEGFAWAYGLGTGVMSLVLMLAYSTPLGRSLYAPMQDGEVHVGTSLTALAVTCAAVWLLGVLATRGRTGSQRDLPRPPRDRWAFVPAVFALLQFASALAPETGWDALAYHLPAACRFAHLGPGPMVGLLDGEGRLGFDLLAAPLLVLWHAAPPQGPAAFHALASIALGAAIFAELRRRVSSRAAAIVASLWLAAPVVADLAGTAYVDLGVALYGFLALAAVARSLRGEGGRNVLAAGLFAGFAANAKLPGLAWVPIVAISLLVGLGVRTGRRPALLAGVVGLLTSVPWAFRAWLNTGDPVFPALSSVFGSGWADPAIVRDATRSILGQTGLERGPWLPVTGLVHGLFDPAFSYDLPSWIAALAPLAIARRMSRENRALVVGGLLAWLAWGIVVPRVRFGYALFAWGAVAAGVGAARLAAASPRIRPAFGVVALGLLALALRDATRERGRIAAVFSKQTAATARFDGDGAVPRDLWWVCHTAPHYAAVLGAPAGVAGPGGMSLDPIRNGLLRTADFGDLDRLQSAFERQSFIESVVLPPRRAGATDDPSTRLREAVETLSRRAREIDPRDDWWHSDGRDEDAALLRDPWSWARVRK